MKLLARFTQLPLQWISPADYLFLNTEMESSRTQNIQEQLTVFQFRVPELKIESITECFVDQLVLFT
jgi:hypothetical protein